MSIGGPREVLPPHGGAELARQVATRLGVPPPAAPAQPRLEVGLEGREGCHHALVRVPGQRLGRGVLVALGSGDELGRADGARFEVAPDGIAAVHIARG